MDAKTIRLYAARLAASGLHLARTEHDGSGNVLRLVEIPWESALPKIVSLTNWRIIDERHEWEAADVTPIRRGDA